MGYHSHGSSGLTLDMAVATGYVVETGIFCIYTCLFLAAFPVLASARRLKDAHSARTAQIFLVISIMMYLIALLHLIFGAFRFYKGIFLPTSPKDRVSYLQDSKNWEFLGLIVLTHIQTWLGDALVIYRCYVVWNNDMWLISVPVFLLVGTIGVNCYVMYWVGHRLDLNYLASVGVLNSIYPLAFSQNLLTTSLIILKILLQHRASKKAGVMHAGSKLSLAYIVRVIIESAAIYTIEILLMNILYFRSNNFQYVVQVAIIPSIGITFLLLAIRIEASRNQCKTTKSNPGIRSSMIPRWLGESNEDLEISSEDREGGSCHSS